MLEQPSLAQVDIATETLHRLGRHIWRGHGAAMLPYVATCLGVTIGDIQRQSRRLFDGRRADMPAVGCHLGDLALNSIRWMGDLDMDPVQCVRVAAGAQQRYAGETR